MTERVAQVMAIARTDARSRPPSRRDRRLPDEDGQGPQRRCDRCLRQAVTTGSRCNPVSRRNGHGGRVADPARAGYAALVGGTPTEAYANRKVAEEIWAPTPNTWVASQLRPEGRGHAGRRGYIFKRRGSSDSGTDACEWIFLGAMIGDYAAGPSCRRRS